MIGTANWLDRVGHTFASLDRAWKALPTPAQLYPPRNMSGASGPNWIAWQGWDAFEREQGGQDEARVKKAIQSPSVFANMRAIATEFASSELVVKERKGSKLEDVDNHPLELLWEAPNPDMGRSFLMSFWAWCYTLPGKAYLYWLPAGGTIKEVWPVPPFMIQPVPDRKNFIGGFAFRSRPDSEPIMIPREYITFSHSPNIFDIRDSLSFLVAGMTSAEMEIAMNMWNRNFFDEQNGIPDGLISVNKDTLDSDLARIRQEIRDFFGGTRRGVAIARETDMKYQAWGRSQKEAEFTQGIELASKQLGRLMGFPDGYWSESANRANAEQARATMIAGAVWPLLVALHEDMNAGVVKRWWGEQFRAEFKDIRPEDRTLKIAEQTLRTQYWTVNELREEDGKDPLKDPRGEMFVAEIGKGTPIPATPAAEMTDEYVQAQEDEVAQLEAEAGMAEGEESEAVPMEETTEEGPPMEEEAAPMKFFNSLGVLEKALATRRAELARSDALALDAEIMEAARSSDLTRWERKALKAFKRFHAADVKFQSDSIPLPEQVRIHEQLRAAETVEDVRRAFDVPIKVDSLMADAVSHASDTANGRSENKARASMGSDKDSVAVSVDDLLDGEWNAALKWAEQVREDT